ncbi:putative mannose-P-dolichol utilization defect 1 protein-like [Scophthalmus maximus]|uniref:Putative mannose-P-dolichol utilization defect 1 protein-like n=1 Tax=Scophthalmus maximus TaxID=52904 RepID=A0A2U9B8B4_SCOMX|nr:mannose-P-dolichol utilization defect 1 protein [Scophthalmus maximus]AWP00187.1 putative mannose-P-dolichol utilization defect 1 protein-like [Scophthalmus maximus]
MATSLLREFLLTFFMPQKCYEEILVNFHWHVPCLLYVLKKAAGYWILLDTLLAPLPQLLKILWRGRADGLSPPSVLLQLYAASCPVVYAVANSFPLFAWAERLFTLAQIAAVAFLVLHHRGKTATGTLLLLSYVGLMFLLGSYAPAAVASGMQASSVASLIASKVLQARSNYCNGHTGQLSTLSVLLTWAGSLGVVFVALQETDGALATLSHVLSACLSCVLLAQVLGGCRRSTAAKKKSE